MSLKCPSFSSLKRYFDCPIFCKKSSIESQSSNLFQEKNSADNSPESVFSSENQIPEINITLTPKKSYEIEITYLENQVQSLKEDDWVLISSENLNDDSVVISLNSPITKNTQDKKYV